MHCILVVGIYGLHGPHQLVGPVLGSEADAAAGLIAILHVFQRAIFVVAVSLLWATATIVAGSIHKMQEKTNSSSSSSSSSSYGHKMCKHITNMYMTRMGEHLNQHVVSFRSLPHFTLKLAPFHPDRTSARLDFFSLYMPI
jgi:hypothetical protein